MFPRRHILGPIFSYRAGPAYNAARPLVTLGDDLTRYQIQPAGVLDTLSGETAGNPNHFLYRIIKKFYLINSSKYNLCRKLSSKDIY